MNDGVGKSIASFNVKVKGGKVTNARSHCIPRKPRRRGHFCSGSPSVPLQGWTTWVARSVVYKGTSTITVPKTCVASANQTMQKWFVTLVWFTMSYLKVWNRHQYSTSTVTKAPSQRTIVTRIWRWLVVDRKIHRIRRHGLPRRYDNGN